MNLVDMKGVRLSRSVFYDPILNLSLVHGDVRVRRMRIKGYGRLAILGEHEDSAAGGRVGVLGALREIERSRAHRVHAAKPDRGPDRRLAAQRLRRSSEL